MCLFEQGRASGTMDVVQEVTPEAERLTVERAPSLVERVHHLALVFTVPTFHNLLVVLTGWASSNAA